MFYRPIKVKNGYVGGFNEERPEMYKQDLFTKDSRFIHMGVDFEAPAGSPVHAIADGLVHAVARNKADGDYGPTLILEHTWNDKPIYTLYGHLSMATLKLHKVGDVVHSDQVIAHLGDESENGGWPPHLHLQISLKPAPHGDMPGVVSLSDREQALETYLDPISILKL